MALGVAFFRLWDLKKKKPRETQTTSFTIATQRVGIHLGIDNKSMPTRLAQSQSPSDRNGFLIRGCIRHSGPRADKGDLQITLD